MKPFFLVDKDALLSEIKKVYTIVDMYDYEDGQDSDVEIRIRFYDGDVEFYWGNSQFDTDHRGCWAYGYLSQKMDYSRLIELAEQLIYELEAQVSIVPREVQ